MRSQRINKRSIRSRLCTAGGARGDAVRNDGVQVRALRAHVADHVRSVRAEVVLKRRGQLRRKRAYLRHYLQRVRRRRHVCRCRHPPVSAADEGACVAGDGRGELSIWCRRTRDDAGVGTRAFSIASTVARTLR